MGAKGETKTTNADFLRYCLKRVWMAEGASEEHGDAVADALMVGIRQGKLNQGLGAFANRLRDSYEDIDTELKNAVFENSDKLIVAPDSIFQIEYIVYSIQCSRIFRHS